MVMHVVISAPMPGPLVLMDGFSVAMRCDTEVQSG